LQPLALGPCRHRPVDRQSALVQTRQQHHQHVPGPAQTRPTILSKGPVPAPPDQHLPAARIRAIHGKI
jgi:hypothetical protein